MFLSTLFSLIFVLSLLDMLFFGYAEKKYEKFVVLQVAYPSNSWRAVASCVIVDIMNCPSVYFAEELKCKRQLSSFTGRKTCCKQLSTKNSEFSSVVGFPYFTLLRNSGKILEKGDIYSFLLSSHKTIFPCLAQGIRCWSANLLDFHSHRQKLWRSLPFNEAPCRSPNNKFTACFGGLFGGVTSFWENILGRHTFNDYERSAPEYLNDNDIAFLQKLGLNSSACISEVEAAYENYIEERELNEKEKLVLKDKWHAVSNKLLGIELQKFLDLNAKKNKNKSFYLPNSVSGVRFSDNDAPSEFSVEYLNTVNWSPVLKEKILSEKRGYSWINSILRSISTVRRIEGGLFQRPSASRFLSISFYMIPLAFIGAIVPQLSSPSIAISIMVAVGLITGRGVPPPKKDEIGRIMEIQPPSLASMMLTVMIIALHGSLGALTAMISMRFVKYISVKVKLEQLMAAFMNLNFWFAALHYKTFISPENVQDNLEDPSLFTPAE